MIDTAVDDVIKGNNDNSTPHVRIEFRATILYTYTPWSDLSQNK